MCIFCIAEDLRKIACLKRVGMECIISLLYKHACNKKHKLKTTQKPSLKKNISISGNKTHSR